MPGRIKKAKVLTVSGGKGGTGKTFVSVNLAVEMARRLSGGGVFGSRISNSRVLLFDADFHLSNAHLMFGEKLSPCLDRFLDDPSSLPHYIVTTQYGVDLISFGGDEKRVNTIEEVTNSEILNALNKLEQQYDWIIVDTGAGLNKVILKQIMFADYTLLVVNPVATSIIDAYKVIKFMVLERKRRPIEICVNMASNYDEGYNCYVKLEKTLRQFGIGVRVFFSGVIYSDPTIFNKSLQSGIPAVAFNEKNHISQSIEILWDQILKKPAVKNIESFFEKIFFSNMSVDEH